MTDQEFNKIMFLVNDIQEFVNQGGHCVYKDTIIVKELWMTLSSHPQRINLSVGTEMFELVNPDTRYSAAYFTLCSLFTIYDVRETSAIFRNR